MPDSQTTETCRPSYDRTNHAYDHIRDRLQERFGLDIDRHHVDDLFLQLMEFGTTMRRNASLKRIQDRGTGIYDDVFFMHLVIYLQWRNVEIFAVVQLFEHKVHTYKSHWRLATILDRQVYQAQGSRCRNRAMTKRDRNKARQRRRRTLRERRENEESD